MKDLFQFLIGKLKSPNIRDKKRGYFLGNPIFIKSRIASHCR